MKRRKQHAIALAGDSVDSAGGFFGICGAAPLRLHEPPQRGFVLSRRSADCHRDKRRDESAVMAGRNRLVSANGRLSPAKLAAFEKS